MYLTTFTGLSLSLKCDGNIEFCMLLSPFQSSVLLLCEENSWNFIYFSISSTGFHHPHSTAVFNAQMETCHISLYNGLSISGKFLWFEIYLVFSMATPIARNPWMLGKKTYLLRNEIGNTHTYRYSGGRMEKALNQVTEWHIRSPPPSHHHPTSILNLSHSRESHAHVRSPPNVIC